MLTEISQDLINSFLSKSDIKSLLNNPSIKKLYDSLSKNSYQTSKVKISHSNHSYPHSDFLAKSLSQKVSERGKVLTLRWTTISNYSVQIILHIYLKDGEDLPNTELLMKSISFITAFSDRKRKITIHLCLLPDKKILRKNQQKIYKLNVNSGSSRFTDRESEIYVFRREEAIKVLFHEVLHGLNCSDLGSEEEITKRLCQKYNLKSEDILINEAYTEIWAKILNCLYITSLTNSNTKFQHFCTLLALEKEFSLYQANKVKQFVKKSKDKNIDDKTNVTAYYLVVGEIFSNLNKFLSMCGDNPYLRNQKICLEYLYELDHLSKRKVSLNDWMYNTMRMSVIELKV